MADYARRGEFARATRRQAEQIRRLKTQRPRRGHVKTLTWIMEGEATEDRFFPPALITIDPVSDGDYPEYKQVVAVHGIVEGGSVTVTWRGNEGIFHTGHVITAGGSAVTLAEPYIIDNSFSFGDWVFPIITAVDDSPTGLSCALIVETVPI